MIVPVREGVLELIASRCRPVLGMLLAKRVYRALRGNLWWAHIVPPLTAVIYLAMNATVSVSGAWSLAEALICFVAFLLSVLFCAAFGYFVNDWSDIALDAAAGKRNAASGLHPLVRILLCLALLLGTFIPWVFLPLARFQSLGLLFCLVGTLLAYSVRPLRFKEHPLLGIICDGLYGHSLPMWIAVGVFWTPLRHESTSPEAIGLLVAGVLILKGIRNILLHQLEDREADARSGVRTWAVLKGEASVQRLIRSRLIVSEILLLVLATGCLLPLTRTPFVMLVVFVVFNLLISLRSEALPLRGPLGLWPLRFTLNHYYEKWLPLGAVLVLSLQRPPFTVFLILHLIFFSSSLVELLRYSKNLRAHEFFHQVVGVCSQWLRRKHA